MTDGGFLTIKIKQRVAIGDGLKMLWFEGVFKHCGDITLFALVGGGQIEVSAE